MNRRGLNWPLWAGLLLAIAAFFSYPSFFVRFPVTRDFPWVNFLLFAVAAFLVVIGLRRTFAAGSTRLARIGSVVAATLSLAALGLFVLTFFVAGRQLPASKGAPQIGQKAPEFQLTDTAGKTVTLSELLSTPINGRQPAGVLLVFYRGYW